MGRKRRWLVVALLVVLIVGTALALWLDHRYQRFFGAGESMIGTLTPMSRALRARDLDSFGQHLAADYRGHELGLLRPETVGERDGIRHLRFSAGNDSPDSLDRRGALSEWRRYLDGFALVEHVEMHVHRLERWLSGRSSGRVATVRFELIGRLAAGGDRGDRAHDRAIVRFAFDDQNPPRILSAEWVEGERVVGSKPHFVDVASAASVGFENRTYPGFEPQAGEPPLEFPMIRHGPGGITAVDYDDDGFHDLFVPDGVRSRLLRNLGDGTFVDVTDTVGLDGLDGVSVGLFADFDNDGDRDAFISRTFRPNQIFLQEQDSTGRRVFQDSTAASGLGNECCTTVASVADVDLDGHLDLYVGRYLDPRRERPPTLYARNGEPNQLYLGRGDGTFENATERAGVGVVGLCLGTVFGDVDLDGDPDLYVVNDFGRNTLYRNEGDGTFRDVTVASGTLAYGAGMNASMADVDRDGHLDLYVTNIRSEIAWMAETPALAAYAKGVMSTGHGLADWPLYWQMVRQSGVNLVPVFQQMASGNTLLRGRGDGTFEDVTWASDANPPGWFWGAAIQDFDNDGRMDIYAANGWIYGEPDTEVELDFFAQVIGRHAEFKTGFYFDPANLDGHSWHGHERNRLLRNEGVGEDGVVRWLEMATPAGVDLLLNSRGVAAADFWNRGVVDLAVAASEDRHALLRNEVGTGRSWLAVELEGTVSNRDAVGARVRLKSGGVEQMREVVLGDGYASQSSLRLHFGLGDDGEADRLTVYWPTTGEEQVFDDALGGCRARRIVRLVEGSPHIECRDVDSR